jgi:hypothetical protein
MLFIIRCADVAHTLRQQRMQVLKYLKCGFGCHLSLGRVNAQLSGRHGKTEELTGNVAMQNASVPCRQDRPQAKQFRPVPGLFNGRGGCFNV